jgi:hypothetical protein
MDRAGSAKILMPALFRIDYNSGNQGAESKNDYH